MTDAPLPGLAADRAALNARAHELVTHALAKRTPLGAFVLHVQPDRVTLDRRDGLSALLRLAGVRVLATKLRRAVVPPGHVLVLLDTEAETHLTLVPVSAFAAPPEAS